MKFFKAIIKRLLILCLIAGLPASWFVFNTILDKSKLASVSAIASSRLNHKKELTLLKAKHKKEISQLKLKNKKKIAKIKMKERSKRLVAAVPIIGTASLLWTGKEEYADYKEWLKNNPEGTADQYASYKANLLIEP